MTEQQSRQCIIYPHECSSRIQKTVWENTKRLEHSEALKKRCDTSKLLFASVTTSSLLLKDIPFLCSKWVRYDQFLSQMIVAGHILVECTKILHGIVKGMHWLFEPYTIRSSHPVWSSFFHTSYVILARIWADRLFFLFYYSFQETFKY